MKPCMIMLQVLLHPTSSPLSVIRAKLIVKVKKKFRQIEVDKSQTVPNRNIFTNFMSFELLQIFLVKLEVDNS